MNRKKLSVIFFVGFAIISGCGKSVSGIKDSNLVENDTLEGDITFSTEETSGDSNEGFVQMSADELLDRFVNGEVSAHCLYDTAKTFYITELDMDSEEWDAYSIGDREDLDNDGEEELILCGPYGGKYLDARDGEVNEFAVGDGTAESLSYTYYQGYVWILYSNEMNSGYKVYHMERYDGADSKVNEMDFSEEYRDENDPEKGSIYVINSDEVSEETYNELCSRIFAAQMNTY